MLVARWIVVSCMALCLVGSEALAKKRKKGSLRVKYLKKRIKTQGKKRRKKRVIPAQTKGAAREIARWFRPMSRKKTDDASLYVVGEMIRTFVASRWGIRLRPKAWKRWVPIRKALRTWSPAPLYRKIRGSWKRLWAFGYMRKFYLFFNVSKKSSALPRKIGKAGINIQLKRVKRSGAQKRRPYRMLITSFANLPGMHVVKVDDLLKNILLRLANPKLNATLPKAQKPLFSWLKGTHSRKVGSWITTRFPVTAHLLDRYLFVRSIMEPLAGTKGLYKLDLRTQWRLPALQRDYPGLAKRLKQRKKNHIYVEIDLLDAKKRRRWLLWSYNRAKMEHRFQAVVGKGGFMWVDKKSWRPVAGPWRPTTMGVRWVTHTKFVLKTRNIRLLISQILLDWRVKRTKTGAKISFALMKQPYFRVYGGELLRLLARFLIPGGVEKMARRFLYNMAHGDRGKGLRWEGELVESTQRSRVWMRTRIPIVPDRILSSILRVLPGLMRMQRRRSARGKKRKKGKKAKKARRKKRRRRRRFRALWNRLYRSIFRDIQNARKVLATK